MSASIRTLVLGTLACTALCVGCSAETAVPLPNPGYAETLMKTTAPHAIGGGPQVVDTTPRMWFGVPVRCDAPRDAWYRPTWCSTIER